MGLQVPIVKLLIYFMTALMVQKTSIFEFPLTCLCIWYHNVSKNVVCSGVMQTETL